MRTAGRRRWRFAACAAALLTTSLAVGTASAGAEEVGLDTTFGDGGSVVYDFEGLIDQARGVLVQPDGRIVAVGDAEIDDRTGSIGFVVRLDPSGAEDPTFGDGGFAFLAVTQYTTVQDVAQQPDGKLVVVGIAAGSSYVARLLANGDADPAFGNGGLVTLPGQLTVLALQNDGKILAAGSVNTGYTTQSDVAVIRLTATGAYDPSFADSGVFLRDIRSTPSNASGDIASGMAVLGDGAIGLVARTGYATYGPPDPSLNETALLRLTGTGHLDGGFGNGGVVVGDYSADGAGYDTPGAVLPYGPSSFVFTVRYSDRSVVAAVGATGALDASFGSSGLTRLAHVAGAITYDAAGRFLLAGYDPSYHEIVDRLTSSGHLDTSFSSVGFRVVPGGYSEWPEAIAVQPDGRIVLAGIAFVDVSDPSAYDADATIARVRPIERTAPPPAPPPTRTAPPPAPQRVGYWMVSSAGETFAFGDAPWLGNMPARPTPAADIEPTPTGRGYWIVNEAGEVYAFGDARWFGNAGPLNIFERVTSMSAMPDGSGYWLFTDRGRVLARGGAPFLGDMGAVRLNGPVLDSIATPSGGGYYLVASDGGIFTFGDAVFQGSMGGTPLNAPVQSLVPDPDGRGYWLVASDGGIFSFDADFHGSMGDVRLNKPVTGMVAFGNGYLMVGADGGIFTFSDRPFVGSLGANPPPRPIVAVSSIP